MYRNLLHLFGGSLIIALCMTGPVLAIDDDAEALGFLPQDAPLVLAVDMDEYASYLNNIGTDWRDADRAHFNDALRSLSNLLAREESIMDVFTFLDHLSGAQAMAVDMDGSVPLLILSAENEDDLHIIADYTIAYFVEKRYQDVLDEINAALSTYYYDSADDEDYDSYSYPETLDDLIEEGYLDEFPINPYTGEPIRVLENDEDGTLGDIYYEPNQPYRSYNLKSWHVGGIITKQGWSSEYEPYPDLAEQLLLLEDNYDLEVMGFHIDESIPDWYFTSRDDTDTVFAVGANNLLFGNDMDELVEAVERYETNSGFSFDSPGNFNTTGAFYRDQVDMTIVFEQMEGMITEEFPLEYSWMMEEMFESMGMEAISKQHTAGWLRTGDMECIRRVELTGEAENSLIGSILHAEPEYLMTAEDGPFGLICEVAWANPDDYVRAYLDYLFEFVLPTVTSATGMGDIGMDPNEMLRMVGLGELDEMDFGDQLYVLLTSSDDRGNDHYLPGITFVLKTDNEDLGYMLVGVMDSLKFIIPGFPFYQAELEDEDAFTWLLDAEYLGDINISPTVAWTDGWVVKSLWREDALAARDALAHNDLFSNDGEPPANTRIRFHRQQLLYALADILYEIPEPGVSMFGAFLQTLAILSEPHERMFIEVVSSEDYIEMHGEFSLDLFEKLIPVIAYMLHAAEDF